MAKSSIMCAGGGYLNASGSFSQFPGGCGDTLGSTGNLLSVAGPAARKRFYIGAAGTFRNLTVAVSANANSDLAFKFYKNGSVGNNVISVPASTTGTFQDTTHTDTVTVGDQFEYVVSVTLGTNPVWRELAIQFDHATNTINFAGSEMTTTSSATNQRYVPLNGTGVNSSTEADYLWAINHTCTISGLSVYIPTNSRSTSMNYLLRKNGANSAMTVTVGAAATGRFTDSTNTVSFVAGDTTTVSFNPVAGSGSHDGGTVNVTIDNGTGDNFEMMISGSVAQAYNAGGKKFTLGTLIAANGVNVKSVYLPVNIQVTKIKALLSTNSNGVVTIGTYDYTTDKSMTITTGSGATGTFSNTGTVNFARATDSPSLSVIAASASTVTARILSFIGSVVAPAAATSRNQGIAYG